MIKKIFSIICASALSLSIAAPCMAKVNESITNTTTHNIYVEGIAANSNSVTLKMEKTDKTVAYADETETESDGKYVFKFKFDDDYKNYTLSINDGGKNITDTVTLTESETLGLVGNINADELADGRFSLTEEITNKLDDAGSCKLIYASYDENDILLGVDSEDFGYDYNTTSTTAEKTAKQGAKKVKIFMWQSLANCIPLAKAASSLPEKNIVLIGDSLGQTYDASDCTKGWGQYLGKYMNGGANIINCCHAGWRTISYLMYDDVNTNNFWLQGWKYAKKFLNEGDYVIFGLGYNDYGQMGYNGTYYDTVDGVKKVYYTADNNDVIKVKPDWAYDRQTDENGTYVETQQGKLYTSCKNGNALTTDSNSGHLSFFYLDDNGVMQSYAADAYYDNMKEMLDDCRELGVNAIIRNVACISYPNSPQSRDNKGYHGFVTHAIINEKAEQLAEEYDNVVTVDLFSETRSHFMDLYNSFANEAPDYAYDSNGELRACYKGVTDWKQRQLFDTYWLTLYTIDKYYKDGEPELQNGSWVYRRADGSYRIQDTLHYCSAGADYMASAIAKLIKQSESSLAEYVK